jgi:hypothetical protein
MKLPPWGVAVTKWSLRHPHVTVAALLMAFSGAGALGFGACRTAATPSPAAAEEPSPLILASREWVTTHDATSGYIVEILEVHPKDRHYSEYDGAFVLWRRSSSGRDLVTRGGFYWRDGGLNVYENEPTRDEKSYRITYELTRCDEGAFDVCLKMNGAPDGPRDWCSNRSLLRTPYRDKPW